MRRCGATRVDGAVRVSGRLYIRTDMWRGGTGEARGYREGGERSTR